MLGQYPSGTEAEAVYKTKLRGPFDVRDVITQSCTHAHTLGERVQ